MVNGDAAGPDGDSPENGPFAIEGFSALRDRLVTRFGCVDTPRMDAERLRSVRSLAIPFEGIVEMYELLWRWRDSYDPNRTCLRGGQVFRRRFGFTLPHTVIISRGRIHMWYFTSKKDGSLMRKKPDNLSCAMVEQEFLKNFAENQEIVAQWIPIASQFQADRSSRSSVEFLNRSDFAMMLSKLSMYNSGVLQEFVYPSGISNSMIRAIEFQNKITLSVRHNRHLLQSSTPLFKRCATFEGWHGLSSVQYKFNPSGAVKSASEDERIRNIAMVLNARVRQESVRQMHFLQSNQYIAFHFKLDRNFVQQFLFASIVTEEEAFSQSLDQLLLEDPVMKSSLVRELPEPTACAESAEVLDDEDRAELAHALESFTEPAVAQTKPAGRKITIPWKPTFIPKAAEMPEMPRVPYNANMVLHHNEEAGRFEYPPPYLTDCVKQPLISWV